MTTRALSAIRLTAGGAWHLLAPNADRTLCGRYRHVAGESWAVMPSTARGASCESCLRIAERRHAFGLDEAGVAPI